MRPVALMLVLLLGACAEGNGYREWDGEYVKLVTRESTDINPCGGQVAFTDRVVRAVAGTWGSETPLGQVVELREDGIVGQSGGAGGDYAWASWQSAFIHEVGHLVVFWEDGSAKPVFAEGVAQMIGNSGQNYHQPVPPVESFAFLDRPEFGAHEYEYSAQLVAFLAQRHGMEAVREAYRRADPGSTPAELEQVFVDVFGDSVYDDFDDLQVGPRCPVFFWECSDAGLPIEMPFALNVDPSTCGDDTNVMGFTSPSSDDWSPTYYGTLSLDEPRTLGITLVNADLARALCGGACRPFEIDAPRAKDFFTSMSGTQLLSIPTEAGLHQVRISPVDPQLPFSATIVDLGPFE